MMAVLPMGVAAGGGSGGGATTGEITFGGTTIWITGAVAAVKRSVNVGVRPGWTTLQPFSGF